VIEEKNIYIKEKIHYHFRYKDLATVNHIVVTTV